MVKKRDTAFPIVWQQKFRARPRDNARDSIYTTSIQAADAAADEFIAVGRDALVEQLYGPVYTIPLERQNR